MTTTMPVVPRTLLSCPFCGGTRIFTEPDERGSGGQWVTPIHVGCNDCKAEQIADTVDEAVERWNRRSAAPGVSTVEDERQAFEAWAEDQGFVLDCDFFEVSGQYYDQDDTQLAYDIWRAARASVAAPAAGDALDAARWRAYAAQFPEISAAFLAMHGADPLPTIKGAAITGGYVVVTPAGWDADKATKLRDAILRLFPVNPAHTPRPSDELAAQRKGDA